MVVKSVGKVNGQVKSSQFKSIQRVVSLGQRGSLGERGSWCSYPM